MSIDLTHRIFPRRGLSLWLLLPRDFLEARWFRAIGEGEPRRLRLHRPQRGTKLKRVLIFLHMQRDLRRIGINVPGGKQNFPQGLKPAFLLALDGMAEAV